LIEDFNAQRGGPDTGHADDVGPFHGRSSKAVDALDVGEITAAKLAVLEFGAAEVRTGEVAAVKANRLQLSLEEVGLDEQSSNVTRARRVNPKDARSTRQPRIATSRNTASGRAMPVRRLVLIAARVALARGLCRLARSQPVSCVSVMPRCSSREPASSTPVSLAV